MNAACPRRYVFTAGRRLRVFCHDSAGSANSAPTLLLIHGVGGRYLHWPPHLRRLPSANVVALDLPGHGESDGPGESTVPAYAAVVQDVMAALRLESVIVAGHSLGAAVALEVARRNPAHTAGIAVLAAGVRLPVADGLIETLRTDFARATAQIVDSAYAVTVQPRMRQTLLKRLRANAPETLIGDYRAAAAFDAAPFAGQLATPALVVSGRQDRIVPPHLSATLHNLLPQSELHMLDDAGHMVMLEQPEAVTALLADFVLRAHAKRRVQSI